MSRVIRAFLVWAMVIAMPVQGMAASMMLFCGPSHQRMMQAGDDHAAAGHAAHEHATPDDAASSGFVDALAETGAATATDGAGGLAAPHGKVSCSACAACCSALALPADLLLPDAASPVNEFQVSSSVPVASRQADGLDRPPRTLLA